MPQHVSAHTREGRPVRAYDRRGKAARYKNGGLVGVRPGVDVYQMSNRNPDYNPELYKWQDETVERIPKEMENRELGYVMEAAGDIFRELTGRVYADDGYISEKVWKIERTLGHPSNLAEFRQPLSPHDWNLAKEYAEAWWSLREERLSPELSAVKQVNVKLAEQSPSSASAFLEGFKDMRGLD